MVIPTFLADACDRIHQSGVIEINSGNNFSLASVVDNRQTNLVVALLIQTEDSRLNKLWTDLKGLESHGFQFSMAGRDFPTYVTVQVSSKNEKAQSIFEKDETMVGFLTFNRLVLDPGCNIQLMSESVPRQISAWRGWASQVVVECGGQLKPLSVLHSSVARIIKAEPGNDKGRESLVELINTCNNDFHSSPLEVHTDSVFVGALHDLYNSLN